MEAITEIIVGTGILVAGTVGTYFGKQTLCEGVEKLKNKNKNDDDFIIEAPVNVEQNEE